jgi:predicted metal-dependent enzyme (double-stranded beta helix superfamily)
MILFSALSLLIRNVEGLVDTSDPGSSEFCETIGRHLAPVVRNGDWIPSDLRAPDPARYRRHLLHEDAEGRFSIGCFTWGAGQATPIHNHRAWGIIGVVAGPLRSETYIKTPDGSVAPTRTDFLDSGTVAWVHPATGDIHRIGGPSDRTGLSIHIYGCRFAEVCLAVFEEPASLHVAA